MKHTFKKIFSACACVALSASLMLTPIVVKAASTGYFKSYSNVALIPNRSGCTAMQGMAVGSKWLYTVKIKSDESKAVLSKTNRNTGEVVNLKTNTGSAYFTYLGHANDMDVTTIDGKSNLFVSTMKTGSDALVRMVVNDTKVTKKGSFNVLLNGANICISNVCIESTTSTKVNFLFKIGTGIYKGSIGINATSGTINLTKVCSVDYNNVKINGKSVDVSSYIHQGMGYKNGKIYIPLWDNVNNRNRSVVAVYNVTSKSSGTVYSNPNLSFRITSSTYSLFEIESCDISSDGKLYFNTNRSDGADGIHYFKDYTC
jgi:hypothetical protein